MTTWTAELHSTKRNTNTNKYNESENKPPLSIAKQPKVRVIPLTPVNYLRYYAWFAQTPAVSYGLFVLLQRHSRPRLTRHATLQLIGRIQSEIFGHHAQIEAIDKQINRFSSDSSFRLRPLLREIERLPKLKSDKM